MNDRYATVYEALKRALPQDEIQLGGHAISLKVVEAVDEISDILTDFFPTCLLFSAGKEKRPLGDITNVGSPNSHMKDYGGSPLKIESCVDYDDIDRRIAESGDKSRKRQFQPLTSKLARELVSVVNTSNLQLPCAIMCLSAPDDKKSTLIVGRYNNSTGSHLFELSYEALTLEACKPKFTKLVREQQRKSIPPAKHVATKASAKYQLLALSANPQTDLACDEVMSSASIHVEWADVDSLLMAPRPQAIATLSLQVVCGDKSSLVYSLYEELECLKELALGLSTGKINWPEVVRTHLPIDLARQLMESQATMDGDDEEVNGNSAALEPRGNLDFTDRLWTILLGCQSYSELLEVIKFVVNSVASNSLPPLMVSASNTNPLAKWIYSQQLGETEGVPDLVSLQVLAYFIEMGVEKLTKDYIHAFLSNFSGLVTVDKLTKFTKSGFSIHDKLKNLGKLHMVLELVSLLHAAIHLPLPTVRAAAASALKHMEDNLSLPEAGFQLSVPVLSISDILNLQNLDVWQLSLGHNEGDNTLVKICRTASGHDALDCEPGDGVEEMFYCSTIRQHSLDPKLCS